MKNESDPKKENNVKVRNIKTNRRIKDERE